MFCLLTVKLLAKKVIHTKKIDNNNIGNMVLRIVSEQIHTIPVLCKHSIYVTIIILLFMREINKRSLPVEDNILTKPEIIARYLIKGV